MINSLGRLVEGRVLTSGQNYGEATVGLKDW
jgi:hypothetical protein